MCQGRFRLAFRKKSSPTEWLGTEQAPQGAVMAPKLPELQEHVDNSLRHRVDYGVSMEGH